MRDIKHINIEKLIQGFGLFFEAAPFNYCVIDDFLKEEIAVKIDSEFLDYDSTEWLHYKSQIEDKKTLNNWNKFPPCTYSLFSELNSSEFTLLLSKLTNKKLYSDPGLHGGGWHCHGNGGNLNPHLDYSIHPKIGLERAINIIIYVSKDLRCDHGGYLGLWSNNPDKNLPLDLCKEIAPKFNRALIFDTTQNSWHGISKPLSLPKNVYRKSLAIYYLTTPNLGADPRARALFAPRKEQEGDKSIEEIILKRSVY